MLTGLQSMMQHVTHHQGASVVHISSCYRLEYSDRVLLRHQLLALNVMLCTAHLPGGSRRPPRTPYSLDSLVFFHCHDQPLSARGREIYYIATALHHRLEYFFWPIPLLRSSSSSRSILLLIYTAATRWFPLVVHPAVTHWLHGLP